MSLTANRSHFFNRCFTHLRYDWTSTRLFQIPRYLELKTTISFEFALQPFTIGYFDLPLVRTFFRFEIVGFNCIHEFPGLALYCRKFRIVWYGDFSLHAIIILTAG